MSYSITQIAEIIGSEVNQKIRSGTIIEHLLYDSRKANFPQHSLFFAIKGKRRDGHQYIAELYQKGVRNFVVSEKLNPVDYPDANFILVENTLAALQQLAAFHRSELARQRKDMSVIAITGSNGKTIVKEWLCQLLQNEYNIARNPRSYNSQIGVPLSVWQMSNVHTLGIFEAGISQTGEMEKLASIIQPNIGVLTNIGEAHSEGFTDKAHKFSEKIKLFKNCEVIIGREKDLMLFDKNKKLFSSGQQVLTWGSSSSAEFVIKSITKKERSTEIILIHRSAEHVFEIPFTDDASIENAISCICVLFYLGYDAKIISERIKFLQPVNMRLELKKGINHCMLINDSYSADLSSLSIALNFLQHQSTGMKRTVILSDFYQSGLDEKTLYTQIAASLLQYKVDRVIGIGEKIAVYLKEYLSALGLEQDYFTSTEEFINHFRFSKFRDETILVKGARVFQFEKIVKVIEQKFHRTVLEIDLNAIAYNLKSFQTLLNPGTKVMAMVKAFAYGSGGAEIANTLQYHHVNYLGVAYADEGVELRKAGIKIPIMVINPEEDAFVSIIENDLEPEIYSVEIFRAFDTFLTKEGLKEYPVHIEVETGMNRLGFATHELEKLGIEIKDKNTCYVQSVFTHLTASDDPQQDAFTKQQAKIFTEACSVFRKKLGYDFIKHISNTAAVIRHPDLQMDMVRLGIGLYGIDNSDSNKIDLQPAATLRATISQIKKIKKGDSVSYGRKGYANNDATIATVRIGYADGFPRRLSHGKGFMWVKGKLAPVIGTVCMDMTMIDITGISDVKEGDEAIVFGKELPVQQVANWAETIPYEIMTGISQRVNRIYFEE